MLLKHSNLTVGFATWPLVGHNLKERKRKKQQKKSYIIFIDQIVSKNSEIL